ncbi:hypothetical protein HDU83_009512, partial [Entophlyctis luteolus]
LQWGNLELYLMSSYCGLALGPTAGNLIGGRIAAERIAKKLWRKWAVETDQMESEEKTDFAVEAEKPDLRTLANMTAAFGNYWEALTGEN